MGHRHGGHCRVRVPAHKAREGKIKMDWLKAALLVVLLSATVGCSVADKSLGHTVAKVTMPDGTTYSWDNTKNIDLGIAYDPTTKAYAIQLKSVTPEQAMANVATANAAVAAALAKVADMLAPLIPAAAKAGAMAGS